MAKKNQNIVKAGTTLAMAVAVTAALANQAQAAEFETPANNFPFNPFNPVSEDSNGSPMFWAMPGTNGAIEADNQETVTENTHIAQSNNEVEDRNDAAAEHNGEISGGQLEDPNLDLPPVPAAPNPNGGSDEAYNEAVGEYNETVGDYNQSVDDYNEAVDDYNEAADAYDQAAQEQFQKDQQQYEDEKAAHEESVKAYEEEKQQYDADKGAYDQYLKDQEEFQRLQAEYEQKFQQYEADKDQHDADSDAYGQYLKDLEAFNKLQAEYEQKFQQYEADKDQHDAASDAYDQYLEDLETFEEELEKYEDAKEQYEADKDRHDQLVTENQIFKDVSDYNAEIEISNGLINDQNTALESGLHANVVENISAVGEINQNIQVDAEITAILNGHGDLTAQYEALQQAAAALENHAGKNAQLGSEIYAEYLAAVDAFNKDVEEFNDAVTTYNNAVTIYNEAVAQYNNTKPADPSTPTTGNGNQQGSEDVDWGNVSFGYKDKTHGEYLTHMDVKYNAAASKDVTIETDANGKETVEYSESVNKYTVTGVYKDQATANTESSKKTPKYSLLYSNDDWATSTKQDLQKTPDYDEFGNTSWNHTGSYLDPENGQISFYVTLEDEDGNTHGITVNMDANSVFAEGSYYKAESSDFLKYYVDSNGQPLKTVIIDGVEYYDVSGESVFLISALTCEGMSYNSKNKALTSHGLDLVLNLQTMIEIHQSANAENISYVNYELAKTAQAYEPGKPGDAPVAPDAPDAPEEVTDPGDAPVAPIAPIAPEEVADPGEAPTDPGVFDKAAPTAPAPTGRLDHAEKLEELEEKVIIVIPEVPEVPAAPEVPNVPQDNPNTNPEPSAANGDTPIPQADAPAETPQTINTPAEPANNPQPVAARTITIIDEKVPLAKAPKTGDLSGIWAVLSSLSLGGISLLNRKRRDQE